MPPEQLNPAEISYVLNQRISPKVVPAMILYWAYLGFLRIADGEKHTLRLIKGREPDDTLQSYEKQMLNRLFEDRETVTANELKEGFYPAVMEFEAAIREKFNVPEHALFAVPFQTSERNTVQDFR